MTRTNDLQQIEAETQALQWVKKIQSGQLASAELDAFGTWMASSQNAAAFDEAEWTANCIQELDRRQEPNWQAWKNEAFDRARDGAPKVEPLANWSELVFAPRTHHAGRRGRRNLAIGAAVAACLAAVVGLLPTQGLLRQETLHFQAGDALREVLLPDGTRLTLDAGTAVDYVRTATDRQLLLPAGRVYLDVAKDPRGARFVVKSGQVETIVLGTRFQVSHNASRTEVMLEEGRVKLQQLGADASAVLSPGEVGSWDDGQTSFKVALANPSSALAWKRGRLVFDNLPLAQAAAEVNRYSRGLQIELADPSLDAITVSGSYLAGDPELIIAAWEATLPVEAQRQGDKVTLKARE